MPIANLLFTVVLLFVCSFPLPSADRAEFARLIASFSEPEGYFDTDNLISNEAGFLDVIAAFGEQRRSGDSSFYLGVGPDQNFSYIAHLRPSVAFLVDIRRGNLLEHLLFRALFEQARNRVEYLCLLLGKPVPADLLAWNDRSIDSVVTMLEATSPSREAFEKQSIEIERRVRTFGVPLTAPDLRIIAGFHQRFFEAGLELRFNSHGRAPRPYYPRLRDLVTARDTKGQPASYLATEQYFQTVKQMQAGNRIVPIVGNLAGPTALRRIARYAAAQKLTLSAIYTSNVEQYLDRDGDLDAFTSNLKTLPRDNRSLIVRSSFSPWTTGNRVSMQLFQKLDAFLSAWDREQLTSWRDIVLASQRP